MLVDLDDELVRTGRRLLIAREVGQVRHILRQADGPQLAECVYLGVSDAVQAAQVDTIHGHVARVSWRPRRVPGRAA